VGSDTGVQTTRGGVGAAHTATMSSRWLGAVVCLWTILVLAADLKVSVQPQIHWFVSAVAVTLVAPLLLRMTLPAFGPGFLPAWLFTLAIVLSSAGSSNPVYGLAQAAKLVLILVVALKFFVTHSRYAHYAFRGFVYSAWLNIALLLPGVLGLAALSQEMSAGRWGTVLSYTGSLWRVGVLSVWWSAYLVLAWEKPLRHLLMLAASLALMYFDGSRTGAVLLFLVAAPFLVVVRVVEAGRSLRSRLATAGVVLAVAVTLIAGWNWAKSQPIDPEASGASARVSQLAVSLESQGAVGLALADPIRAQMLQAGLAAVHDASLVGPGIQATQVETGVGVMPVHMTYFQLLGDLGWLGLLAYLWLVLAWLPWLPRAWANIRRLSSAAERALYYNAIFLLFFFLFAGLLHPLSSEWSEWVTFVIPYALFWEAVRVSPRSVQGDAAA